jgi:Contractile injection system tube protein
MERVAFLVEATGDRLTCLLNPDSLIVRRSAGVEWSAAGGGRLTGAALTDDPVVFTGGGRTELELELLFDTGLVDAPARRVSDVRSLTRPLWSLAETPTDTSAQPPLVRFVWGKSWNVRGIVTAAAERLEHFSAGGAPQRSWLKLRLWRVAEDSAAGEQDGGSPPGPGDLPLTGNFPPDAPADLVPLAHSGRLDLVAARHLGHPGRWRAIARQNALRDAARVPAGTLLRVPRTAAP